MRAFMTRHLLASSHLVGFLMQAMTNIHMLVTWISFDLYNLPHTIVPLDSSFLIVTLSFQISPPGNLNQNLPFRYGSQYRPLKDPWNISDSGEALYASQVKHLFTPTS